MGSWLEHFLFQCNRYDWRKPMSTHCSWSPVGAQSGKSPRMFRKDALWFLQQERLLYYQFSGMQLYREGMVDVRWRIEAPPTLRVRSTASSPVIFITGTHGDHAVRVLKKSLMGKIKSFLHGSPHARRRKKFFYSPSVIFIAGTHWGPAVRVLKKSLMGKIKSHAFHGRSV